MISVGSWKCRQCMLDCQRATCKNVFPFPTAWVSGDQTHILRLGSKQLYPLSHLADPARNKWNLFLLLYYLNPTFLRHSTAVV